MKWNLKGDLWERIKNKKPEPDTGKKLKGKAKEIVMRVGLSKTKGEERRGEEEEEVDESGMREGRA